MGIETVSVEDLHQVLDAEIRKLTSPADWQKVLDLSALMPRFGFGNLILINVQMPQANWVARAQVWERLGRRVTKKNAIRILEPVRSRTAVGAGVEDAARRLATDGAVQPQVIGFRVGLVYDVTNTVGPPVHLPLRSVPGNPPVPAGLWDALAREATLDGLSVDVRPTGDGSPGHTDHDTRQIVVADHLDDVAAVERLAHEVGHLRLHSHADVAATRSLMCHGIREIEAESVAYVVLANHGLSPEASHFGDVIHRVAADYPADPADALKMVGARIVNASRQIIDSTTSYLMASRTPLPSVAARPLDSVFLVPDSAGPAL